MKKIEIDMNDLNNILKEYDNDEYEASPLNVLSFVKRIFDKYDTQKYKQESSRLMKEQLKLYVLKFAFDGWEDATQKNVLQAIDDFLIQYPIEHNEREDKWINIKDRKPKPEDSPILSIDSLDYFSIRALRYINGWDGVGWYDASDEYGMGLDKEEAFYNEFSGMIYWMYLPKLPKIKSSQD